MDNKLSQLEQIQTHIKSISSRMDTMEQKMKDFEVKMKSLETRKVVDSTFLNDISSGQKEMNTLITKVKTYEKDYGQRERKMREEITDLKCRSMRDNLMCYQIPEEKDENCEKTILDCIEQKIKIENAMRLRT